MIGREKKQSLPEKSTVKIVRIYVQQIPKLEFKINKWKGWYDLKSASTLN